MRRRKWNQIAVGNGGYWLNGNVYTDLDEPLRLAKKNAFASNKLFRIWMRRNERYKLILLSPYRTSKDWGNPHTEKLPFEKIWPIFEAYARML